ncbi:MAG: hypothetical protein PVJ76_04815 [Gemmatimonadota bacterium]|jgi:hypothetical protein
MGTNNETRKTEGNRKAPLRFSTINGVLAAAGIFTVALGFFLLSKGSITAAPLLLVLGYVILLPLAIIL